MSVISLKSYDKILELVDQPVMVSGGINVDKVHFELDDSWDGFACTAVFYRNRNERYESVLDVNSNAKIPWEVLKDAGVIYIGVYGVKSGDDGSAETQTSEMLRYDVGTGACTGGMNSEYTEDVLTQVLEKLATIKGETYITNEEIDAIAV